MTADQSTAPLETPMPEPAKPDPNCWVLDYPNGEYSELDVEVHFASEVLAARSVEPQESADWRKPTPRRLPAVCVTISCFCCETTFNEEDEGVEHHQSIESAREAATGCGWRIAADGTPFCEDCKDGKCDCAADLPAPPTVTEVHPAQVPLPLGEEPEPGDVWKVSDGTVPIGGVSPESFVIHSDWNGGHPVAIVEIEDSARAYGVTFVAWRDVRKPEGRSTIVRVPSDMQVTPCTLTGATPAPLPLGEEA